jgi:hypothetical protein
MKTVVVRPAVPAAVPRGGVPVVDPLRVHWMWWRSRTRRSRLLTRPLLAPSSAGRLRLPGTGVETVLVEAPDPYHRPCALVLVPATGHISAALAVAPPVTPPTSNDVPPGGLDRGWTADLGTWLTLLSHEPGLAGSAVFCHRAAERPGGVEVLVQLTWTGAAPDVRADPAAAAVWVLRRIPRLVQSLTDGAVGRARPLSAAQLAVVVREAYRRSGASGDQRAGGRPWSEAVPPGFEESWDQLRHDGMASVTWSLNQVPPQVVLETSGLQSAALPQDGARTRVTLLHHPGDRDAVGAVPTRLTSLLTLTATPEVLPAAAHSLLGRLPVSLRPCLRPVYGSQAAAFAAGLPTGTLLAAHAAPMTLRNGPDERGS